MNSDLAYCLERFIDDQIQLIDDCLETIKENEITEHHRIEEMKLSSIVERKTQTNEDSHDEDAMIVQRFVERLLDNAESSTAAASDIENYRGMLRTEFSTKVDDCLNLVIRLRKLAQPILGSDDFVTQCNETVDRLQQGQRTDQSYHELYDIVEQSNHNDVAEKVQEWWDNIYGSAVIRIINLNKRFNPGVSNNDIALVPPRSRIIEYAKKILSARKQELLVNAQKYDIVREFVHQIQPIDDENHKETNEEDFINQLNSSGIDFAMDYAQTWLNKRNANRKQNEPEDSYDKLWQETKVLFDRQRIAQESKKLDLATLLCRLAIGSANVEQFNRKLKKTLTEHKQGNGLPIITGDIGEPRDEKLLMAIYLEEANTDEWSKNSNRIQDKFSSALCQAFLIPDGSIRIIRIERGSVIIRAYVLPPYGKDIVESLNGTALDSPKRIEAVRKCCQAVKGKVESITLDEFGLSIDQQLMDPTWNRKYKWSRSDAEEGEYWERPTDRGGKPYFCPSGWFRFGIKVAENEKEFDARWGDWYLAYYGTKSKYAVDILATGLHVITEGCYYNAGIPRVYVSPSIEYCAHTRYAEPWTKTENNGKTRWFQLVFQCRVNPKAVKKIRSETLLHNSYKDKMTIDPNFKNTELEWIIPGKEGIYRMNQDIICYGLMMRASDSNPEQLPPSTWWKYVH